MGSGLRILTTQTIFIIDIMINKFIIKSRCIYLRELNRDVKICKADGTLSEIGDKIKLLNKAFTLGYAACEEDYKIKSDKICKKFGI